MNVDRKFINAQTPGKPIQYSNPGQTPSFAQKGPQAFMDLISQLEGWTSILRHSTGRVENLGKVVSTLQDSVDYLDSKLDRKKNRVRSNTIIPVHVEDFSRKPSMRESEKGPHVVLRSPLSDDQRDAFRKALGKTDIWRSIHILCVFLAEGLHISNTTNEYEFENDETFRDIVSAFRKHEDDLLEIEDIVNNTVLSLWRKV